MTVDLSNVGRGFADPTHGSQQTFRTLLEAMAHPGRVTTLPSAALSGIEPPEGLSLALTAALLSLLDADTSLYLAGHLGTRLSRDHLRFHTGTQLARPGRAADFVAAAATDLDTDLLGELQLGSDEAPQHGATLLLQVAGFDHPRSPTFELRGPGIESVRHLVVDGVPDAFWAWRLEVQRQLPRGVDVLMCCDRQIAALPRTTSATRAPEEG